MRVVNVQYYLGVDVGASFIRIGVIDGGGRVIEKIKVPMPPEGNEDTVANIIIKGAKEDLAKYLPSISAVGIGSIGPLDLKTGNVIIAPNLRWRVKRFRLYAPLRIGLKLPIIIGNDAMASVWGEYLFGQGVGKNNVVYITLSTGIGMGVIVDGHLLVGKDGNAHEMGHAVVDIESDLQCGCGGYGHLEAIAGGGNIPKSARWYLEKRYRGQMSEVALMVKEGKATTPDIFNGYKRGDSFAVEFIDYALSIVKNVEHELRAAGTIRGTISDNLPIPLYYTVTELGKGMGVVPSLTSLLRRLGELGIEAHRTHFSSEGVKTDAEPWRLIRMVSSLLPADD